MNISSHEFHDLDATAFSWFDLLPTPIWVFDRETLRIVAANAAACALLGYQAAELTRRTIADIRPEPDRPALRRAVRAFACAQADAGRWRILPRTGDMLEASFHWRAVRFEGRDAVLATIHDQTEDLRARRELSLAEGLLRLAGEKVRLGGWRVELDPQRVIWTPETAAIHGLAAGAEPSLDAAFAYYVPEDRLRITAAFDRCVETGTPFDEVGELETETGERIWVRAMGSAERDTSGAIVAVQGALQDISELRAAQERAEMADRQRLDVLESMSDAVFTLDRDWCVSYLNGQAEALLERERADIVGKHVWSAFPEARGTTFEREYERAVRTGRIARFEAHYPPLGKWFEVSAYPIPEGLAVYFRDVTEERARTEHLRLLETAVARQNDILLITEADPVDPPEGPRVVYVNDAFAHQTGFTREEIIGRTPRILQGPETSRAELDRVRAALQECEPVRAELVNYTRDGTPFWVEIDVSPIFDAAGKATHFVAVQRDITGRKRAEERVRLSDERFRLLARATNDVIWDWDFRTGTVWWNDNVETVFGHVPETLETGPESWTARLHPDDRTAILRSIRALIEGEEVNRSAEYRFRRADGTYATVLDRGFVVRDAAGKALRMIGSMIDVTRQRDLESRLREAQKLEAVGQLTGGVAHDFNNLLTVIIGNADELNTRLAKVPDLRQMAEITLKAAERGAELTNRLLAFARRQTLQPRVLDLNGLIGSMDGLLRRTLSESIDIEIVRAPGLWAVEADASQLEVAILNLVINARDAMADGGTLRIDTANVRLDATDAGQEADAAPGDYAMIAISDTGTGMTPEVCARAFEPFFTTKDLGKGSGLGLSMVFGFVKQSGGHVTLESAAGRGTTVRLYLPRRGGAASDDDAGAGEAVHLGGSEHILVVEDDALVRGYLVAQLVSLGYRVTSRENGPRALDLLRQANDVDLLFTDLVMPGGMTGVDLADAARAVAPHLKVLFTSGYAESALPQDARLARGIDLLSKPYRRHDLAAKVRAILDRAP